MPTKTLEGRVPDWVLIGLAVMLAAVDAPLVIRGLGEHHYARDFLALWTAAKMAWTAPSSLYDFQAVTAAQRWLLGAMPGVRPAPYPPSAFLLLAPLTLLPFWPASSLFLGGGVATSVAAVKRVFERRPWLGALLVLLTPGVVVGLIFGQAHLIYGAAILLALLVLPRRPILAGVLLGVAACFKPTILVLAPLALLAGGHWKALLSATITGLAVIALSVLAFGVQPWFAWIAALPRFLDLIAVDASSAFVITPTALGTHWGLTGAALLLWRGLFAVGGVLLVVAVFRRSTDLAERLTALVGGAIMLAPYALGYEVAVLAPVAIIPLLARDPATPWPRAVGGVLFLALANVAMLAPLGVLGFIGLTLAPRFSSAPASQPA